MSSAELHDTRHTVARCFLFGLGGAGRAAHNTRHPIAHMKSNIWKWKHLEINMKVNLESESLVLLGIWNVKSAGAYLEWVLHFVFRCRFQI